MTKPIQLYGEDKTKIKVTQLVTLLKKLDYKQTQNTIEYNKSSDQGSEFLRLDHWVMMCL